MNFDLSDEQRLLRDTARDWFGRHPGPDAARRLLGGEAPGPALLDGLAEIGFCGVLVDAEHGGSGLEVIDLCVVAEEAGRVLSTVPLVGTAAFAAALLGALPASQPRSGLLRGIAEARERCSPVSGVSAAREEGQRWRLEGTSAPAIDAVSATAHLVRARTGDGEALLVARPGPGVELVAQEPIDATRGLARLRFDDAPAELLAEGEAAVRAWERGERVATVVLCAEDLGAAARALELAVAYAGERVAFGRPIGSFQAVKHMCVGMFVRCEQLRSLVWFAAWAADRDPDQLPLAVAAAKAYGSQAFEESAEALVQVHGGIGFTWEHDAHLFWRRAKVDRLLLGDVVEHRARVAELALAGA